MSDGQLSGGRPLAACRARAATAHPVGRATYLTQAIQLSDYELTFASLAVVLCGTLVETRSQYERCLTDVSHSSLLFGSS